MTGSLAAEIATDARWSRQKKVKVKTMSKPLVFNYKDYEELEKKYIELEYKMAKQKADNTNLLIRCRIAEARVKELEDEEQQKKRKSV